MNSNRKRSLLRIISLHGDRRKPPLCVGYRPFAFLKASRHYNNDETAGNEMLRLLHSPLRNCCKSANKAFGRRCDERNPARREQAFPALSRMAAGGAPRGIDPRIALHQPAFGAHAIAIAPCGKPSPRLAVA
jgi:hypothetical protein